MNKQIENRDEVNRSQAESVLVLYENPAAREQAIRFCDQFAQTSGNEAEPEAKWYSFDSLAAQATSDEAAQKAAAADMIIFAVKGAGDLPEKIKLWSERWLGKRREREGVLVGLVLGDGTNPSDVACLKEIYLRHLAHRAGMDYLSHVPRTIPKTMPDSPDSLNERAAQVTSVLDEILRVRFVPPSLRL